MSIRIPEKQKRPGVHYAVTDDGVELPVIDITHPAFALGEIDPGDWSAQREAHYRMTERFEKSPAFLRRLMLWIYRRNSILMRGLLEAEGTFLSALSTYLLKLGPENLGKGYAGRIDRKIAASFPAFNARIRLRDASEAIAFSVARTLAARPVRGLHMVNIAGGHAADCLNALILLRQKHHELLAGCDINIHVLDLHGEAPNFGRNALAVLQNEHKPLHGLNARFIHHVYDWSDTKPLSDLLEIIGPDALTIGSSEGGLFVYGSDETIAANLEVLHKGTPEDFVLVGSVLWHDERLPAHHGKLAVRTFTPDEFRRLIDMTGWAAEIHQNSPGCEVVSLRKK